MLLRRSSLTALLVAGCAAHRAPPPRVTVVAHETPAPTGPLAPRVRCEVGDAPRVADGYRVLQWPTAPRFLGVEVQAGVLYGTTSSAVCASVDGGRVWRTLLDDVDWPALHLAPGRLWVRTGVDLEGNSVSPARWWRSDDTGDHWAQPEGPPPPAEPNSVTVRVPRQGDSRAVVCGGALFATVPRGDGLTWVLQSLDGDDTWQRVRGLGLPSIPLGVRCVGAGAVLIERENHIPVAVSRDTGASWRAVRAPAAALRNTELAQTEVGSGNTDRGCDVWGQRGLLCELNGQTWVSDDDGRRWHPGHSPVGGRSFATRGARLLAVGGGVAESADGGRRWALVAPASGRHNLGLRGGILDGALWLASSALWWSDDGGTRWSASLLEFQLVAVLGRRRWVGFEPGADSQSCAGRVRVTLDGGARWRTPLRQAIQRVQQTSNGIEAIGCGAVPQTWVSRDGLRWARLDGPPGAESGESASPVRTVDGLVVEVRDGQLVCARPDGSQQILSTRWPRDVQPVAAASVGATLETVLFGNGTVLRHEP